MWPSVVVTDAKFRRDILLPCDEIVVCLIRPYEAKPFSATSFHICDGSSRHGPWTP